MKLFLTLSLIILSSTQASARSPNECGRDQCKVIFPEMIKYNEANETNRQILINLYKKFAIENKIQVPKDINPAALHQDIFYKYRTSAELRRAYENFWAAERGLELTLNQVEENLFDSYSTEKNSSIRNYRGNIDLGTILIPHSKYLKCKIKKNTDCKANQAYTIFKKNYSLALEACMQLDLNDQARREMYNSQASRLHNPNCPYMD